MQVENPIPIPIPQSPKNTPKSSSPHFFGVAISVEHA